MPEFKPNSGQITEAAPELLPEKASLTFEDHTGPRRFLVWTRRKCLAGKSNELADLVCIPLPPSPINVKRAYYISREHFTLMTNETGVEIRNISKNGTYLDGRRIKSPEVLKDGQIVSLANVMPLRYREFRSLDEAREVRCVLDTCTTPMDCAASLSTVRLERARKSAPLDCFRLWRLDEFKDKLEYLFLVRSATVGSSPGAAIRVDDPSVSEFHAEISLRGDRLFIEDLKSVGGTRHNGKRLAPYALESLDGAATITLGRVALHFSLA